MKTVSPFVHGLSNGASLTTDISGLRFNPKYVLAIARKYGQSEQSTEHYIKGQKLGLMLAGLIGVLALLSAGLLILVWNQEFWGASLVIVWQALSIGNGFYAIKYEREIIDGKV